MSFPRKHFRLATRICNQHLIGNFGVWCLCLLPFWPYYNFGDQQRGGAGRGGARAEREILARTSFWPVGSYWLDAVSVCKCILLSYVRGSDALNQLLINQSDPLATPLGFSPCQDSALATRHSSGVELTQVELSLPWISRSCHSTLKGYCIFKHKT